MRMVRRAMERGGGRISEVFCDAAERQGAYDLLEGARVSGEALMASMSAACVERGDDGEFVLIPIDGSNIRVVDRDKRTDLGLVGTYTNNARGLQVVSALAVTEHGTPLGLCAQTWWTRSTKKKPRSHSTYRPVHERESRYTVWTIQDALRSYSQSKCKPWIVVDRGGDATVILDELVRSRARFTVRCSWNRCVGNRNTQAKLRGVLANQRVQAHYTVHVPPGHKRKERLARVAVRRASVELNLKHDWQAKRSNPTLNVLWIHESRPPHGEKPLDWMLYTNSPIETVNDMLRVVHSYTMRWRIEDFHKTWKSGHCRVEEIRLRSAAAVRTWATLLAAVATRIERLKHLARTEPDLAATVELSDIELDALKLLKRQQKKKTEVVGDGVPTIAVAVRWIADLGGYTGKSSGGPPGATTIGRGLEDLAVAARVLSMVRENPKEFGLARMKR
ncbi:IS4 family transposase [Pendulispora brunnea]|uniref:IS4 family transposase n=2 Tax=Pendulispora brunnea TaxID=2905690 RepID=A0ABZ2JW85_9BACT